MAASLMTVVREMPSSSAMAVFGTPSAASRLMYARSSNVITLPCSGVQLSAANLFSFRAASTVEDPWSRESSPRGSVAVVTTFGGGDGTMFELSPSLSWELLPAGSQKARFSTSPTLMPREVLRLRSNL